MRRWIVLLLSVLCGGSGLSAEPVRHVINGVAYRVLTVSPEKVRIVWKDGEGRILRRFPAAARYLDEQGEKVAALMNGGIFEPGGVPSGLLVVAGEQQQPLNLADGNGNFFLKPNGVFLIGAKGAAVVRANEYPAHAAGVRWAVQSGPLLIRAGKVHPAFLKDSDSRLHRNGVGVNDKGEVVLIITEIRSAKKPNLYEFAQVFARFGCRDALFLDGDISQLRTGKSMTRFSNRFGSIIAVVE
ncbi:phosphodiester glycosidase family protein [Sulfuriroseicoccus oceanibius]|uniref:Phosphodiester glycosidase family protein n=1 Tax=Sulfuriroseicoccus oceanibius TaxID=2707525 RepID=A0A6B3L9E7_9BACT|nr:phosphodiester glycosidase family protein [Sulfuriroseicoccus oceanibius]QQL46238.1 phosphodiester glycosidase family protein [Sulfuriroseicoccus oceanibius]